MFTLLFSKSSRMKVTALLLMPINRLMQDRETYAVLGTLNMYDIGYIIGVTDHLKRSTPRRFQSKCGIKVQQ